MIKAVVKLKGERRPRVYSALRASRDRTCIVVITKFHGKEEKVHVFPLEVIEWMTEEPIW